MNDKLQIQINEMQKQIDALTFKVKELADTSFKTSKRDIINHEVQFLQKCYRADGTLITSINP